MKSVDGYDSFITFTDDYFQFGYIYLTKERTEALDKFKIFKAKIENQHNLKIKIVRLVKCLDFLQGSYRKMV
jgi:hypothetical protein